MDFEIQLKNARQRQHQKYLCKLEDDEKKNIVEKKIYVLAKLTHKYFGIDPIENATRKIQKCIRSKFFYSNLINNEDLQSIPAIYRFRVKFLEHSKSEMFSYCFDIRKIYPIRTKKIQLCGKYYFLKENDIQRLTKIYQKICGSDSASIIYLNQLDYSRVLAHDMIPIRTTYDYTYYMEKISKIINESEKIFNIDGIKIDNNYLSNLNKKYFTN